jgi:biopolymer transport protein ExbD
VSRMVFRERKRRGVDLNVNVTSLIDVLFLLLIFFMLTSTFKHAGELDLNLPESSTAHPVGIGTGTAEDNADLVLTEKGTLMLDGNSVTFESLPAALSTLHERHPRAQIMIEAESGVPHGQVVKLLDAVRTAGFKGVGLGTTTRPPGGKSGRR